jgi:hypothetical protein
MSTRPFLCLSLLVTALAVGCGGPAIDCGQVTYGNCGVLVQARANARSEQEFRDLQQCYREYCATDDGSDDAGDE